MRHSRSRLSAFAALLALGLTTPVVAGDEHHGHAHETPTPAAPEMTAEQAAAMKAWQAAMTPGAAHRVLAPTVGTWTASSKIWEGPDQPPMVSEGHSVNRWILGKRYVEQVYTNVFMGMPFEGHGFTGFDNVRGKYVGSWIDNFGTGVMTSVGEADASGKTLTFTAKYFDSATQAEQVVREVLHVHGPNRHTFEMFGTDRASGKEFRMMEVLYTRATGAGQ